MGDFDNNVIALMVLQEENRQLKYKLEKVEQIVNAELYVNGSQGKIEDIREVLEQE